MIHRPTVPRADPRAKFTLRNYPADADNRHTLHHVFVLPMPANAGNTKSRVRKASKQTIKKRSSTSKRKNATRALRPKLTDEQKRELRRVRAAEPALAARPRNPVGELDRV